MIPQPCMQVLLSVLEGCPFALLSTDESGRVVHVNEALCAALGYDPDDLLGTEPWELWPEAERQRVRASVLESGLHRMEGDLRRKDGELRPFEMTFAAAQSASLAPCFILLARELRVERQLRAELHQATQLDRLGRFAGGIAHDFNNHISVILNYTYIVNRQLADRPALQPHLQEMQQAAWDAANLTQQLLVFGRKNVAEPQTVELSPIIDDMAVLLAKLLGSRMPLHLDLASDCWPVRVSLPELEQTVIDLVVCMRDERGGEGSLQITTANVEVSAGQADLEEGRYVRLRMRAMPHARRDDTPGRLGLQMVRASIHRAGGRFLERTDHETLDIYLPAMREGDPAAIVPPGEIRSSV